MLCYVNAMPCYVTATFLESPITRLKYGQIGDCPGEKNVINNPHRDKQNYTAPLHIKLGFIKNFTKEMDKDVRANFPQLSDALVKESILLSSC